MKNIKIVSTGKYLPANVVTNTDMSLIVDTSDEWIYSRTGIKERRQAIGEETVDMAYKAALDAIKRANYDIDKIDLVIVASITQEDKTPSIANKVVGMLGIKREIMSFDINAACTGYVYGLEIASALLSSSNHYSALVIGSERLSGILDYSDRNTCVLFGDGAGASIIERSNDAADEVFFVNNSRPDKVDALTVDKYIKMDGKKVYQFAVEVLSKQIKAVLEKANLTISDIDMIISHQANMRIIKSVSNSLEISMDKFLMNIDKYGNTSAASIPILLSEYEFTKKKAKVLMVGFGGGFTYGAAIMNVEGVK
ncbi:MAG TPA: beta-ketoacyl-ACP synthase III [Acholeplasma sp.]|nr:beta-ketoacyl-ACP synthase III [Acholeplasma sp.]